MKLSDVNFVYSAKLSGDTYISTHQLKTDEDGEVDSKNMAQEGTRFWLGFNAVDIPRGEHIPITITVGE